MSSGRATFCPGQPLAGRGAPAPGPVPPHRQGARGRCGALSLTGSLTRVDPPPPQ